MIIQHNIMALNSYNRLSGNNSLVSKNLEKLSSGYKINRAGDDAAGLAISEKMRAQITGLSRASQNAQDGISLVQTAEGNLTEVHSMLNRMVDLATQSSNGTYDGANGVDRTNLEKEMQSLKDEIDRIASSAHFNGIKLLDGSLGGGAAAGAAVTVENMTVNGAAVTGTDVAAKTDLYTSGAVNQKAGATGGIAATVTVTYKDATGADVSKDITFDSGTTDTATATSFINALKADKGLSDTFTIAGDETGVTFTAKAAGANKGNIKTITVKDAGTDTVGVAAGTHNTTGADATKTYKMDGTLKTGDKMKINGKEYTYAAAPAAGTKTEFSTLAGLKTLLDADGVTADITDTTKVTFTPKAGAAGAGAGLNLQIGDTAEQVVKVSVGDMSVKALGLDAVSILDETNANTSIKVIKDAINTVSGTRADLGAIQNRLEHTINNLATTTENMTAAESRIRDTDMAKEMMAFTKNNVLSQAAQAMLAQANQQPQQVLQLLR